MGRTLVLECTFGIAGDMLAGALLDLGGSQEKLDSVLGGLPVAGFSTKVSRVEKSGLDTCDFDVILDEEHDGHDHDMGYLHGDGHDHDHAHGHGEVHAHGHEHHHEHRGLADVLAIVDGSTATPAAKAIATRAFSILADAEAKAHGTTPDAVHFHEVGAVDSIVDVLACAVLIDDLAVDDVVVEALADGHGTIRCQHGIIPVPVPAVTNIVAAHAIPLRSVDVAGELTTPTGAALVAAVRTASHLPGRYLVRAVGLGAGKRAYDCPGYLRALLVDTQAADDSGRLVWRLEADMDDCPGEALGHALDDLLAAGAREAHYLPLQMKKGRPGWQLQVICDETHIPALEQVIFADTTTIGIRRAPMERTTLAREQVIVETRHGSLHAKAVTLPDGTGRVYPEHDDVVRLSREAGISYQDAWQEAISACRAATL